MLFELSLCKYVLYDSGIHNALYPLPVAAIWWHMLYIIQLQQKAQCIKYAINFCVYIAFCAIFWNVNCYLKSFHGLVFKYVLKTILAKLCMMFFYGADQQLVNQPDYILTWLLISSMINICCRVVDPDWPQSGSGFGSSIIA
jgi:hypothetical protein